MTRLWYRIGVRSVSATLLVAGLIGGVHLGLTRSEASTTATLGESDAADIQLLQQRQSQHAAARASQRLELQRKAESYAADKGAGEAKSAAAKAHKLEAKVVAKRKAAEAKKRAEESGAPVPYDGPIPSSCDDYAGSRAIGCTLMLQKGFAIDQFPCLDKLWSHESGWNYKAANPSGAYGIPQALPGRKMSSAGANWKNSPATQIKWGLGYIKGRYRTPCGAWSNFQSNGNY